MNCGCTVCSSTRCHACGRDAAATQNLRKTSSAVFSHVVFMRDRKRARGRSVNVSRNSQVFLRSFSYKERQILPQRLLSVSHPIGAKTGLRQRHGYRYWFWDSLHCNVTGTTEDPVPRTDVAAGTTVCDSLHKARPGRGLRPFQVALLILGSRLAPTTSNVQGGPGPCRRREAY